MKAGLSYWVIVVGLGVARNRCYWLEAGLEPARFADSLTGSPIGMQNRRCAKDLPGSDSTKG